jgi:hypothetical protein
MTLHLQLVQHFIIDLMQHSKALYFFPDDPAYEMFFSPVISIKLSRKCRREALMPNINIHHYGYYER